MKGRYEDMYYVAYLLVVVALVIVIGGISCIFNVEESLGISLLIAGIVIGAFSIRYIHIKKVEYRRSDVAAAERESDRLANEERRLSRKIDNIVQLRDGMQSNIERFESIASISNSKDMRLMIDQDKGRIIALDVLRDAYSQELASMRLLHQESDIQTIVARYEMKDGPIMDEAESFLASKSAATISPEQRARMFALRKDICSLQPSAAGCN